MTNLSVNNVNKSKRISSRSDYFDTGFSCYVSIRFKSRHGLMRWEVGGGRWEGGGGEEEKRGGRW